LTFDVTVHFGDVLHPPPTKFEVCQSPSSEDMVHFPSQWLLTGGKLDALGVSGLLESARQVNVAKF